MSRAKTEKVVSEQGQHRYRQDSRYINHASRIGVKGSMAVGWDSQVFAVVEYGTDFDRGKSKTFPLRDAYAGLRRDDNELSFGQMNTPTKRAQGKVDLFNDVLDMNTLIAGENNGDMISVATMMQDYKLMLARIVDGDDDGLGYGWSASFSWSIPTSPYNVTGADSQPQGNTYMAVSLDSDVNAMDSWRFLTVTERGRWSWQSLIQGARKEEISSRFDYALLLGLAYRSQRSVYKIQLIRSDVESGVKGFGGIKGQGARSIAFGVDYPLLRSILVHGYAGFAENHHYHAHSLGVGITYSF